MVGKLRTVSVEDPVVSKSLKVFWRLDCSERVGIVIGYKIHYCEVASLDDTADCINGEEHILTSSSSISAEIKGLKPWTFYKVGVAVVTRAGEGEVSDYIVKRTKRGPPGSPPNNLEFALTNQNEVEVFWNPPLLPNGPIKNYELHYTYVNFRQKSISVESHVTGRRTVLKNLTSNVEYKVAVRACAEWIEGYADPCGPWSKGTIKTKIGRKILIMIFSKPSISLYFI